MRIADCINDIKASLAIRGVTNLAMTDDLIIKFVNIQRALYFQRKYLKADDALDYQDIQTIPFVKCQISGDSLDRNIRNRNVWLVSDPIPQPVFVRRNPLIAAYLNLFHTKFVYRTPDEIVYANSRFTDSKQCYYTYNMDKLYFKIPKDNIDISTITGVSLDIIAEDPLEVLKLAGKDLYQDPFEVYPITDADWNFIKDAVLRYNIALIPPDTSTKGTNNVNGATSRE